MSVESTVFLLMLIGALIHGSCALECLACKDVEGTACENDVVEGKTGVTAETCSGDNQKCAYAKLTQFKEGGKLTVSSANSDIVGIHNESLFCNTLFA